MRLIHRASGARGEGREFREQLQNKRAAFKRLLETDAWKRWHRAEVARRLGQTALLDADVDGQMRPENLRVEVQTAHGWIEESMLVGVA